MDLRSPTLAPLGLTFTCGFPRSRYNRGRVAPVELSSRIKARHSGARQFAFLTTRLPISLFWNAPVTFYLLSPCHLNSKRNSFVLCVFMVFVLFCLNQFFCFNFYFFCFQFFVIYIFSICSLIVFGLISQFYFFLWYSCPTTCQF